MLLSLENQFSLDGDSVLYLVQYLQQFVSIQLVSDFLRFEMRHVCV